MENFPDPFFGVIPKRRLSSRDLQRVLRLALSEKKDMIRLGEILIDACEDTIAKKILQNRIKIRESVKLKN